MFVCRVSCVYLPRPPGILFFIIFILSLLLPPLPLPPPPDCLEHQPKTDWDWECPERVLSILELLVKPRMFDPFELEITTEFNAANTESLMRVHSGPYIKFVDALGKKLEVGGGVGGLG